MKLLIGNWPRLLGIGLVVILLLRADLAGVSETLKAAHVGGLVGAFLLTLPMIFLKSTRWQSILMAQGIRMGTIPAYVSYLGGVFLGAVTPGRVGEFARVFHVTEHSDASRTLAFSSVLADRLFDLYMLLIVGATALALVTDGAIQLVVILAIVIGAIVPLAAVASDTVFSWVEVPVQWCRTRVPRLPWKLFDLLVGVRGGLRAVNSRVMTLACVLTVASIGIFFAQSYLIARSAGIDISFVTVCLVIALGSLIAILPVSISGLGTRDVVIVTYLGTQGINGDAALGYSLLIFLVLGVGSGLLGAIAWFARPVRFKAVKP